MKVYTIKKIKVRIFLILTYFCIHCNYIFFQKKEEGKIRLTSSANVIFPEKEIKKKEGKSNAVFGGR